MKRPLLNILLLLTLLIEFNCIVYRLNGIEYPNLNRKKNSEANGWEIRTGNARETELKESYSRYQRFIEIELSVKNQSGKKRKFKYTVQEFEKRNLRHVIGNSIASSIAYAINPDWYDAEDFYQKAGLAISYQVVGENKRRSHSCSRIPDEYFWGLFKSSRYTSATSDWISHGSTHNVTVYCRVEGQPHAIELEYYGHKIATFGEEDYTEAVKKSLQFE